MAKLVISYDLRQPQRDYSKLYNRLNAWKALRVLESVWLIISPTATSVSLRDDLQQYIDSNDRLFVARLTGEAAWNSLLADSEVVRRKLTE